MRHFYRTAVAAVSAAAVLALTACASNRNDPYYGGGYQGTAPAYPAPSQNPYATEFGRVSNIEVLHNCRIPDDCIDSNRYPLFMARAVLQELIESLQSISGVQPC